ncbi:MAG: acyl-CoA dehydrogenase family protein [Myxococcota bacterium]
MSHSEHRLLRQTLQNFVSKEIEPGALVRDRDEHFDLALFRKLASVGLLGITAPAEFGGSDMDPLAAVIAHEELSYSDPGLCLAYLAHAMLCVNNIANNASVEQKAKYLPKLCSGEWVGCMAMSEPGVGTDVLGMTTTATLQGDHYIVNGRKMWITNGVLDNDSAPADVVYLYAKTGTKLSTFIITPDCPGYSVGQKIKGKTGMRASNTAELVFEQCQVPMANRVGEEGASIKHMMKNLAMERLTLAAMGLGIGRRSLKIMINYANERTAFGKKLTEFGQIQQHIADSYAEYQAARAYVYETARGNMSRLDSDGVKLIAARMAKKLADSAMQVLGGNGYVAEYVAERLWRDAKLLEIGGGTLEAHQKNIAVDLSKAGDLDLCGGLD